MGDYEDQHPGFMDPHRPALKPVDPRATASQPTDCTLIGSIDNQSTLNLASGQSEPWTC